MSPASRSTCSACGSIHCRMAASSTRVSGAGSVGGFAGAEDLVFIVWVVCLLFPIGPSFGPSAPLHVVRSASAEPLVDGYAEGKCSDLQSPIVPGWTWDRHTPSTCLRRLLECRTWKMTAGQTCSVGRSLGGRRISVNSTSTLADPDLGFVALKLRSRTTCQYTYETIERIPNPRSQHEALLVRDKQQGARGNRQLFVLNHCEFIFGQIGHCVARNDRP